MKHLIVIVLLCSACAGLPAAQPAAVQLDDVSAAAYQAGRTQQAAQTADAATATGAARSDAWTATAAVRTEVVAAAAATLRAGADAATARALTPTLTPLPSATPVPTGTPAPTWTSTPNATVAALVVEAAAADRDTAVLRAWIVTGMLAVLGLGILVAVLYGIGLMWASWESRMADAKRKQHIPAGPYYDMATGQVVGLLPEPERPAAQTPAQDESVAYTAEWQRGYWTFARWLEVLPPADRTRAAMSGIVSNHGWNVYMAGLREMSGVLTKDGKVYRLVATPDEVRRACVAVIPPFDRASPTLAPAVRPVDAAYRRTVATPTEAAEAV